MRSVHTTPQRGQPLGPPMPRNIHCATGTTTPAPTAAPTSEQTNKDASQPRVLLLNRELHAEHEVDERHEGDDDEHDEVRDVAQDATLASLGERVPLNASRLQLSVMQTPDTPPTEDAASTDQTHTQDTNVIQAALHMPATTTSAYNQHQTI